MIDRARADRLTAFLTRLNGSPVVWGETDCSAAPALWMAEETGKEIILPAYCSREEAHAIIKRRGDLASLWSDMAARIGVMEQYGEPELGDVAVIDTRLHGQIGGICALGRILIIRRDDGGWHWFGPVRQFVKVFAVS